VLCLWCVYLSNSRFVCSVNEYAHQHDLRNEMEKYVWAGSTELYRSILVMWLICWLLYRLNFFVVLIQCLLWILLVISLSYTHFLSVFWNLVFIEMALEINFGLEVKGILVNVVWKVAVLYVKIYTCCINVIQNYSWLCTYV